MYTLQCHGCRTIYEADENWSLCPKCNYSGRELSRSEYHEWKCGNNGCEIIYKGEAGTQAACPRCGYVGSIWNY